MHSSKRPLSVHSDEEGESISGPVAKKQCSLPLRISPSSSPRRLSMQTLQSVGPYTIPPTLTPAESSDEDVEEGERLSVLTAFNISEPSTASSFRSTKVIVSEGDAMDMTDMPPPAAGDWKKQRLARQRSNGISSIAPLMQVNSPPNTDQPDANARRIPTPIYGHFTSTDVNMDTSEAAMNSFIHPAARFQLRHSHNVLSPMMSEDGESEADWWRKRRLPSPAESPFTLPQTDVDDLGSPSMIDALSFDNIQMHNSEANHAGSSSPPLSCSSKGSKGHAMFERRSNASSETPRKGKLVMGFRADCEKCHKHVPGHYSHIVWD